MAARSVAKVWLDPTTTYGDAVGITVTLIILVFLAYYLLRGLRLLWLRSGLWITIFDMPLRIYGRNGVIVRPERARLVQCFQRAQFGIARR